MTTPTMLRITTHDDGNLFTFQLERKLAGPWVNELRDCWQHLVRDRPVRAVCIDLSSVTFIDAAGKDLLTVMYQQGAELVATGCLMRALVSEIKDQTAEVKVQTPDL